MIATLGLSFQLEAQEAAERFTGVAVDRGWVTTPAGYRVRTYLTRPVGAENDRLPAIAFVQWLSCDPVTVNPEAQDGWSTMLRGLIEQSGVAVLRTEKPGVGASEGPECGELGYLEELAAHRASLDWLRQRPDVHADSIVLYGASMGGTMVPLLAHDAPVLGVIAWGATGFTWAEHLLRLDRRVLELRGADPSLIADAVGEQMLLHARYLERREAPPRIVAGDSAMAQAWGRVIGTGANHQYGRPFLFHQEAHHANWEGAWGGITAPVLVVHGTYDWFFDTEEHAQIVATVERAGGRAQLASVGGVDHHFEHYPSLRAAFEGEGETVDTRALEIILRQIQEWRRE